MGRRVGRREEGEGEERGGGGVERRRHPSRHANSSYLQPHGSRGPRKTSGALVAFLSEKALLAARPRLAVGSLQADSGAGGEHRCLVPTSWRGAGCPSVLAQGYSQRGLAVRWGLEDP